MLVSTVSGGTFNHADVVGSVPYGQRDCVLVLFDQLHHLSLLQRSDSAANHCFTHARRPQELELHAVLKCIRLQRNERQMRAGKKQVVLVGFLRNVI